jgi:GDPmannose 4,6-dehydratase
MTTTKVALITGIQGMDGSFLAELLLSKGYIVHGIIRMKSEISGKRLDKIYQDRHEKNVSFFLHYGDLTDTSSIDCVIREVQPDEIYHLGAMSHVRVSFDIPEYAGNCDAIGTLRILESIRKNINKPIKMYNACTSELYGGIYQEKQNEMTPFCPKSPYACAKLYSFWISKIYRESYNLFIVNGILFNHTSYRRGDTFLEQKVVKGAVAILKNKQDCLYLGNIYSSRDIGHSKDYVRGMYLMLQQDEPEDYVLATGTKYFIKDIVDLVFLKLKMPLTWKNEGVNEIGILEDERVVIRIDPKYFRPSEVDSLEGDATKAREKLNWVPEYTFENIIDEMIEQELMNYV